MLNVESQRPKEQLHLNTSSHLVLPAVMSMASSESDAGINFRNILNSQVRTTFILIIGKSKNMWFSPLISEDLPVWGSVIARGTF